MDQVFACEILHKCYLQSVIPGKNISMVNNVNSRQNGNLIRNLFVLLYCLEKGQYIKLEMLI